MDSAARRSVAVLRVAAVAAVAYPFLPLTDSTSWVYYDVVALGAMLLALWGVAHHRPVRRQGWLWVSAGFSGWVVGHLVTAVEQDVWHLASYPVPSHAIYLGAYVIVAAGVLLMVRARRAGRSMTAPRAVPVARVRYLRCACSTCLRSSPRQLAARLDCMGGSTVLESAGAEEIEPGHANIAPGDNHFEVRKTARGARTVLTQGPLVNFCRPSVDTLFRSVVRVYGDDVLAVVLTGMGADGGPGCADVIAAGGTVMVQDEASSVVWGMPGAVATVGFAHRIVPIDQVGAVQHADANAMGCSR